jgi:type II secretory pathway pseudopilin PulG
MVVVAIIGILSAMAVTMFGRLQPREQLRASTKDLISTLRQARTITVTGASPTTSFPFLVERVDVVFDPGLGEYRVQLFTLDPAAAPPVLTYKVVRLADYIGADLTLVLNAPLPGNILRFERNGGTTAFGDISLTETQTAMTNRINVTRAGVARIVD